MSGRVLFYVQHLLGIGHLHRAAAIARAMQQRGLEVVFVSGGRPLPGLDLGGAELVQLPSAAAADAGFSAILDEAGRPVDEAWRARRRALLLQSFQQVAPAVVLLEMFPFARRQFRFELLPLLDAAFARPQRPAVAVSVRDILVDKNKPERVEEVVALVRARIDCVLVHADPRLASLALTFPAADRIADRLRYTGYVLGTAAAPGAGGARGPGGEVLVSAGGGSVGEPLLRAALAARPLSSLAAAPWRLLAGPHLPEPVFRDLVQAAPAGVTVERFRTDFPALLRRCAVSVSQAGYNTVMEVLAAAAPAVLVPFAEGQESEQTLRARLLALRGRVSLVEADALGPARLAEAIDAVWRQGAVGVVDLDLGGAAASAQIVGELAEAASQGWLDAAGPGNKARVPQQ